MVPGLHTDWVRRGAHEGPFRLVPWFVIQTGCTCHPGSGLVHQSASPFVLVSFLPSFSISRLAIVSQLSERPVAEQVDRIIFGRSPSWSKRLLPWRCARRSRQRACLPRHPSRWGNRSRREPADRLPPPRSLWQLPDRCWQSPQ
jgi:hypothetical protein